MAGCLILSEGTILPILSGVSRLNNLDGRIAVNDEF
jgi:hypothetical protein